MNALLAQLDHLSYETLVSLYGGGEPESTDGYHVSGEIYWKAGKSIEIRAKWEATLAIISVSRNDDKFVAEFLPRIDMRGYELVSFPWRDMVEEQEIELWLKEFAESVSVYDDISECLPVPEPWESEVEDCLADRRRGRGEKN